MSHSMHSRTYFTRVNSFYNVESSGARISPRQKFSRRQQIKKNATQRSFPQLALKFADSKFCAEYYVVHMLRCWQKTKNQRAGFCGKFLRVHGVVHSTPQEKEQKRRFSKVNISYY